MFPFINIHTHSINSNELSIVNLDYDEVLPDAVYCSYGLHPWDIGKIDEQTVIDKLEFYCKNKKIIAVGEIGIDRAIDTQIDLQKDFFIKQLRIAQYYNMPVIIHSVRGNSDLLQVKKLLNNTGNWILHDFRGSIQNALQLINKQYFISFGKSIFTNKKVQLVLKQIPIEKIFIETDNNDLKIEDVYREVAKILNVNIEDLQKQIFLNFKKVFSINE